MKATTSRLAEALRTGRFALLCECVPPRGADAPALKSLAAAFASSLDAVVVTESREDVVSSPLACAAVLAAEKVECVLSLVTRDRNRVALESDVLGAAALGVQGFLCMTGEHQALGRNRAAAGAYDIDSVQLAQAITNMASRGVGFRGDKLGAAPPVFALAVAHPALQPTALNTLALEKKAAAGARAVLTDAIADVSLFETWMASVRAAGLDKRMAIVASIAPGNGSADLARKVRSVPGVRGIHILCGGSPSAAAELIASAGLA